MPLFTRVAAISLVLLLSLGSAARACTTFVLESGGTVVFGRNYDWHLGEAFVVVNKRGVKKMALVPFGKPAKWVSKYGSVTFNQYGCEFPNGGMNEAGLVVEVMWLDETRYPTADDRPMLLPSQWVQYQLDNAATVADVLASDKDVRVFDFIGVPIHFLICDKQGNAATVEFIKGERVVHTGDDLVVKVLANATYDKAAEGLKRIKGFGGRQTARPWREGGSRFNCAAAMVKEARAANKPPVEAAQEILDAVAQGDHTRWQIVYNVTEGKIHFHTSVSPKRRMLELKRLDLSADAPRQVVDIDVAAEGAIHDRLKPYTTQANQRLINLTAAKTFNKKQLPAALILLAAFYPETCVAADVQMDGMGE